MRPNTIKTFVVSAYLLAIAWAAFGAGNTATSNDPFTAQQRKYWAFQKIVRPPVPEVADARWAVSPIAAFILAKLQANHLKPTPPADRVTLLRRVSFDLIGLPPTTEEIDA